MRHDPLPLTGFAVGALLALFVMAQQRPWPAVAVVLCAVLGLAWLVWCTKWRDAISRGE